MIMRANPAQIAPEGKRSDAYKRAVDPKELVWVKGAGHVDLYDRVNLIPWEKLESFLQRHLAA
jgi:uncharacterized protein